MGSLDNSFSIAAGYGLGFHSEQVIQTGSGAHPDSYPMGIGGSFLGVKPLGHEADHSLPSSAEVKNGEAISPPPPIQPDDMVMN
jgi:hypothetical protein